MKISAQDEYGLRILIRIAQEGGREGLNITQLSEAEGMSTSYVAKLTRTLRMAGFIKSTRGQKGGYVLARPAQQINIGEVLHTLGGALFDASFCESHSAGNKICTNSVDCSVRSLWRVAQRALDQVFSQLHLSDLLASEQEADQTLAKMMRQLTVVTA